MISDELTMEERLRKIRMQASATLEEWWDNPVKSTWAEMPAELADTLHIILHYATVEAENGSDVPSSR